MKNAIDFTTMPRRYTVCWHSDCPLAGDCLRHLATEHLGKEQAVVPSVNLRAVSPESGTCPQQRPARTMTVAWGMHRLYDEVRVADKESLYQSIRYELGNTMYYRYRNGERPITPEVQEVIARAFRQKGYTGGVKYDRTEEVTAW